MQEATSFVKPCSECYTGPLKRSKLKLACVHAVQTSKSKLVTSVSYYYEVAKLYEATT